MASPLPYLFFAGLFSLHKPSSAEKSKKQTKKPRRNSKSVRAEGTRERQIEGRSQTLRGDGRKKGWEGGESGGGRGRRIAKDERRKMNNAADSNLPVLCTCTGSVREGQLSHREQS